MHFNHFSIKNQYVNPNELFYALALGNCVQCTFLFLFLCSCFLKAIFAHSYILHSNILNTKNLHTVVWFQVFLSNINNYMVSCFYFYLIIVICLLTVIWFHVTDLYIYVYKGEPSICLCVCINARL